MFRALGAVVASVALLVGCTNDPTTTPKPEPKPEPEPEPEPKETILTATVEATRTSLNDRGEVLWSVNDEIRVFGDEDMYDFAMTEGSNTTTATFEGFLPESVSGDYVATYPANMWSSAVTLVTPAEQRYKRGSFANNTNPMVATFDNNDTDITFRNLMGVLKFQLVGTGTIDNIVISNESVILAGEFEVTPDKATMKTISGSKVLTLKDVGVTLGTEPEAFYVLVPPATYGNLKIEVNCTDGTQVVREAQVDVTIKRNEVLPLSPIDISATPDKHMVEGVINEERTKWNEVSFDMTYSEECVEAYVGWAYTSEYERMLEQYPDWTIVDLFNNWMSYMDADGDTCNIRIVPNVEYTYVFLGFDGEGNYEFYEFAYTNVAEFGDAVGVDIAITNVTPHSADYTYTFTGDVECFYDMIIVGDYAELLISDPQVVFANLYGYEKFEVTSNSHTFPLTNLTPGEDYTFVVIAEGADGSLAYNVKTIVTPQYTHSDVTIDYEAECGDTWIKLELSGNWTSYKYEWFKNPSFDLDKIDKSNYEAMLNGNGYAHNTSSTLEFKYENAETEYIIMLLPYDADGNYGNLVAFSVTTSAPYYREGSALYRSYIGTWNMSFNNMAGSNFENYSTVTIEEEYEGSSYIVKGLSLGFAADDSMRAYFIDDKLYLIAGERIADPTDDFGSGVFIIVSEDNYVRQYGYLVATLNGDTLTFESSEATVDMMTIWYYDFDGSSLGYYEPLMVNSRWTRELNTGGSTGASTEDFKLGNTVDAGWM